MAELKGIIRNQIHRAFVQFHKDNKLRDFARSIAGVADYSVRSAGNAYIMYEQIDVETESEVE